MINKIFLASGGIDSSVLLTEYHDANSLVLFFNYGQKSYNQEYAHISALCNKLNVSIKVLDITNLFTESKSNIIKHNEMPTYQLLNEQYIPTNIGVENRNSLFIMIATTLALQLYGTECTQIYLGIMKSSFLDCSEEFYNQYNKFLQVSTNNVVSICVPYIGLTKHEVLKRAKKLNVSIEDT